MPDDQEWEDLDPVMKAYMFYQWTEKQNEQVELFKNLGYLIGSFSNPEAVRQMMNANTYSSSDESFEAATELVSKSKKPEQVEEKKAGRRKRRRRKVN